MTTHPYTVPVIAGDLRRAELVKQTADIFEYLDAISQDMFNRIATRLNIYRAELNKFDGRIQHANAHIDRIKGSKRAIQVHSSARYPVEQNRSTYKSIFECDPEHEETKAPVLHYNLFRLNETVDKFIDPNDKESKSNDEQVIVLKQYEDNFLQKTKKNVLKGLGRPPTNIKSVLSFLTYNTQENPYTQPTKIDPLSIGGRKQRQADEPTQPRIGESPAPAFYSQKSERPMAGGIGYNPTLGIVPQMSLPDNLTELGDYALFDDDAATDWNKQQMTSIAPSFAISMLPDLDDLSSTNKTTTQLVEPPKTTALPPPPVDLPAIIPLTSAPPPAPHPPPPPAPPLPTQVAPPAPLLIPPSVSNTDGGEGALPSVKNNDDDDEGSSGNPLMDQIRNFAKRSKLKSADQANPVNPAPIPSSNEQENIMDMLKERLKQRRGFITGDTAPSSAPKSIAAPIPPPVTGGAFTDAIALKAKEIAAEKGKDSDGDENDDGDGDDWE